MSETTHNVTRFMDSNGKMQSYVPMYERYPQFLETYPTDAYAVAIEVREAAEFQQELMDLYKTALANGINPDEIASLPDLKAAGVGSKRVAIARLYRLDTDQVVAKEYAEKAVDDYKDLESLVTAARQRLLAALGFGSEQFMADEQNDMADQGIAPIQGALAEHATPAQGGGKSQEEAAPSYGFGSHGPIKPQAERPKETRPIR